VTKKTPAYVSPLSVSPLPAGWEEVIADDGRMYFWNVQTDQVTWERPGSKSPPATPMYPRPAEQKPVVYPQRPLYTDQQSIAYPQRPVYTDQNPVAYPQRPVYTEQKAVYPQRPVYTDQNPVAYPQRPVYTEQKAPTAYPQRPLFTEEKKAAKKRAHAPAGPVLPKETDVLLAGTNLNEGGHTSIGLPTNLIRL